MKTQHSRLASLPLTAALTMALAWPLATLARPAQTRPAAASHEGTKVAKDVSTNEVALPARRSCQPTDDSEYAEDVAGGPATEASNDGIEVGMAEPGEARIEMLEMSPEEEAAFDAAVAAYEKYNRESGNCEEADADAATADQRP